VAATVLWSGGLGRRGAGELGMALEGLKGGQTGASKGKWSLGRDLTMDAVGVARRDAR
jgi:hypothetical protein